MITYEHEIYIEQAIEGVLMQKTNFEYELIIVNDCSHDNTDAIVKRYVKEHSKGYRIKNIKNNRNKGMVSNFLFALDLCKGKYIALCEGDDYWIDSDKLQKQVNFLDLNTDYGIIFTDADRFYEENNKIIHNYNKIYRKKIPTGFVLDILLNGNPYITCTSMFKAELIKKNCTLNKMKKFKIGDRFLWLLIAGKHKFGYIADSTAVYRIRKNSASHFDALHNKILYQRSSYKLVNYFSSFYNFTSNKNIKKTNYKEPIAQYCLNNGLYIDAFKYSNCGIIFKIFMIQFVKKVVSLQ